MIQANELRIGNLLCLTIPYNVRTVWKITPHDVYLDDEQTVRFDEKMDDEYYLKPIPLTEEWLIKAGFEKEEELTFVILFPNLDLELCLIDFVENWQVSLSSPFGMVNLRFINHLHELQNLVKEISGTELTINL